MKQGASTLHIIKATTCCTYVINIILVIVEKDWSDRVLSIINRKEEKACNQIMLTNFVTSFIFN